MHLAKSLFTFVGLFAISGCALGDGGDGGDTEDPTESADEAISHGGFVASTITVDGHCFSAAQGTETAEIRIMNLTNRVRTAKLIIKTSKATWEPRWFNIAPHGTVISSESSDKDILTATVYQFKATGRFFDVSLGRNGCR